MIRRPRTLRDPRPIGTHRDAALAVAAWDGWSISASRGTGGSGRRWPYWCFVGLSLRLNRRDTGGAFAAGFVVFAIDASCHAPVPGGLVLQLDRRVECVAVRPSRVVVMPPTPARAWQSETPKGAKAVPMEEMPIDLYQ